MAKARKTRKKKARGKRVPFVLFLIAAGLVLYGRHELLWGFKGYVLGEIDFYRIESQSDLPPPSEARARPAEVVGIPDYKNPFRFPYQGRALSCYRMVDFGNRLVVCSDKGLKRPEGIEEIIRERTIRGKLERLKKSPLRDRLQRIFSQVGRIQLPEDAFLLSEEKSPLPSPVRLGVLAFCVILCCFSAWRLIKQ